MRDVSECWRAWTQGTLGVATEAIFCQAIVLDRVATCWNTVVSYFIRLLKMIMHGITSPASESALAIVNGLPRQERYAIAARIITDIDEEWSLADSQIWQAEHVDSYESNWSFDELAAEVRGVVFKTEEPMTASSDLLEA